MIECTELRIVHAAGNKSVLLSTTEHGGSIVASGKDGESKVALGIIEDDGYVATRDKYGDTKILD